MFHVDIFISCRLSGVSGEEHCMFHVDVFISCRLSGVSGEDYFMFHVDVFISCRLSGVSGNEHCISKSTEPMTVILHSCAFSGFWTLTLKLTQHFDLIYNIGKSD